MKIERAFTMVEILVVTAIIATVVTVPIIAFGSLNRNARDTRRKQDVEKVAAALQQYRNEKGKYPEVATYDALATELIPKHLSALPNDPQGNQSLNYKYEVLNGGNSFILSAGLEKTVGGNNELFTVTQEGSKSITGTPPVPSVYSSPTGPGGGDLQRTPIPTRTPTPTVPVANESYLRNIGGTGQDVTYDAAIGSDKGVAVVGVTDFFASKKGYLVKYSPLGTKLWEKSLTENNSTVNAITPVSNGFAIVGVHNGTSFISKITNDGNPVWTRRMVTDQTGFTAQAVRLSSTELFVAGAFTDGSNEGFAIFKYNTDGALLGKYILGMGNAVGFTVTDIQPATDGVAVIGFFNSLLSEKTESYFVNLSQDLSTIVSKRTYTAASEQQLQSLVKTSSGYLAAGVYNATGNDANGWIITLEPDGDISGTNTGVFSGLANQADGFNSIVTVPGGYLVVGDTNSFSDRSGVPHGNEGLILKLSNYNTVSWLRTLGKENNGDRLTAGGYQSGTTPYYFVAGEIFEGSQTDIVTAKLTTDGVINSCSQLYTPATSMTVSTGGTSTTTALFTKSSYTDASSAIYTMTFGTATTSSANNCN